LLGYNSTYDIPSPKVGVEDKGTAAFIPAAIFAEGALVVSTVPGDATLRCTLVLRGEHDGE